MFKHKQNWRLIHCVSIAVACMKSHADICAKHYVNAAAIKVIEKFGIFKKPIRTNRSSDTAESILFAFSEPTAKACGLIFEFLPGTPRPSHYKLVTAKTNAYKSNQITLKLHYR